MFVFDNCQEIYEYIEKTATERFGNCERAEYRFITMYVEVTT